MGLFMQNLSSTDMANRQEKLTMLSYETTRKLSGTHSGNTGVFQLRKSLQSVNVTVFTSGFVARLAQQRSKSAVFSVFSSWIVGLAVVLLLLTPRTIHANGIPVQVFLDYLPFKSTWEAAKLGRGVAVIASNDEVVRVNAQNLPQPPNGTVYYAWLEKTNGEYLSVGPLNYQPDGTASIDQTMPELPYSENFAWVLISVENSGGIGSSPSSDIALAGRLPNPVALPETSNSAPEFLPVTGASVPDPFIHGSDVLAIVLLATVVSSYYVFRLAHVGIIGSRQRMQRSKIDSDDSNR
jgi:hypothetical protein